MRKTILRTSAILLVLASLAGAYSGGNGTAVDPYQIATAQDLIDLGHTPDDYGKSFVLTADIDLADWVFDRAVIAPDTEGDIVVGDGLVFRTFDGTPFSGQFDGQGYVIHNLCIDEAMSSYQGLFGKLDTRAKITDLGLDGVQVSGHSYVGALVGHNSSGVISSSYSTGTVSGEEEIGGLVGRNYSGTISASYSAGSVGGGERVGGLVGFNSSGTISSSYSTSTVYGGEETGGLVGDNRFGTISSSHSTGRVSGTRKAGGLVGDNTSGAISTSYSTGRVSGNYHVGGLAGYIHESGTISSSSSTGPVHGTYAVGGLLGTLYKSGTVSSCYSTGSVFGGAWRVGGLVGSFFTSGTVSSCYSTGRVCGTQDVGGLIGYTYNGSNSEWGFHGTISSCFWDIESSEQIQSEGGTGLTTTQMQDSATYMQDGWNLTVHPVNSPDTNWWMLESDTPRLRWQYGYTHSPYPTNETTTSNRELTLQWRPGGLDLQHDVYFGDDKNLVANAGPQSQDVYLGRQPVETLSYELDPLEPGKTYYWRIDGVKEGDHASVYKGNVWSFTITDYVAVRVLDDFESYDDHCNRIYFTWQDGIGHMAGADVGGCDNVEPYSGNGTGAMVGNAEPPYASQVIAHNGSQAMPIYYDNTSSPWFSVVEHNFPTPQDWISYDADTLTLYLRGEVENTQDVLYIAIEDSHGDIAIVEHSDASAILTTQWQVWHVFLSELDMAGVNISEITKLFIGVGNPDHPQLTAAGKLYIDDIQLTKRGI